MEEQDKSEEATPFKKQEARKKGTVTKSLDVFACASTAVLLLVLLLLAPLMIRQCLQLFSQAMQFPSQGLYSFEHLIAWGAPLIKSLFNVLLPLWGMLIVASILVGAVQVGFIVSFEPLKPDWKRINPVHGFKRLFSVRMLFEALKSTLKFLVFAYIFYYFIKVALGEWLKLNYSSYLMVIKNFSSSFIKIVAWLFLAMIIIALIDWLFVRRTVNKKLKMSKREVKDEYKRREGDPRIKAKLKEIRLDFLRKVRSTARVKESDVLIVNPQHFAIAVQYKRAEMAVPVLIAKGAGELALKMKKIASREGIPILENRILARGLYKQVNVDDLIPEEFYIDVAKALVWAFKIKNRKKYGKNN